MRTMLSTSPERPKNASNVFDRTGLSFADVALDAASVLN